MKRALLIGIAALFLATGTAHAGSQVCAVVLKTSDGFLALRSGPGVSYPMKRKLKRGDKVVMMEIGDEAVRRAEHDTWVSVFPLDSDIHDLSGWVRSKYIQVYNTSCDE